ncbi:MAG: rhamnulokinase [Pedosphaera sp. Tous-C6FEB]|nr:MAG: rhamnulokinase [Pedosphaera sp. Tous-C6FEB]
MGTHYIGIDLGAESGRVMLGSLADGCLTLEEVHRFANTPLRNAGSWHWDLPALWSGVQAGLRQVARRQLPIASVSVDSWGLDCVLLDARGEVITPVFHYRDSRTERGVKTLFAKVPWAEVFAETGIQFMPINQLYHLAAETPERLARTAQIVPLGDVFNYFLSGVARAEVSLASTTQLYNPRTRTWSKPLLDALGLAPAQFPPVVEPGTKLGRLKPEVAGETGLSADLQVIATCTHDTGAAVAGIPVQGSEFKVPSPTWAYLSSGTWSLLGLELTAPILTDRCRELNFTNEIGFGNSVRLLKNIVGLWLVQECRRDWAGAGRDFDYAALTQLATEAEPFRSLINPADPRFLAPDAMPERIAAACRASGQPAPETPGQFVRCVLESLALEYRRTLRQAEELAGLRVERLHIVGGGSKNALLNQFTANAVGLPVLAGPTEATAIGNILVQAIALGHLPSLAAGREVVGQSFATARFEPGDGDQWDAAWERFVRLP